MTARTALPTVLVTGGAGFIGAALSRRLADRAGRWIALDNLHPQVHPGGERPLALHPGVELVVGDVTQRSTWESVLDEVRPDIVIHLAAETGTAQSLDEASRHAEVNVTGTTRMLDAFSRAGFVPARILLSSSRAVYGEGRWQRADGAVFSPGQRSHAQLEAGDWDFDGARPLASAADATPPAPTSVYGATKLAQENILTAWARAKGAEPVVLRLQNVYGPGQSLINSYTGIVSLFSQLAEAGRSIPVYEDGAITRDFVLIDDVVSAFEAAVFAPSAVVDGATFDIGSGTPTTVLELASAIAAYHGAPGPHITGQFRDGDVRSASCDISATVVRLGWRPQHTLVSGIAMLQEWMAGQSDRIR
ncbi:NAD(P)-dependent oxidoreductase [uncultured Leifsonia sp.]|uniref:NAD-dependent epimerase/dehydratase family protein n=1 Tax=uncultured Leifsonia sp. TaxID=340359 RepID=UPI0025D320BC|nr:NAD-dependent epimerase/dehydratase family protein [uncultured Leifsonia sp.]